MLNAGRAGAEVYRNSPAAFRKGITTGITGLEDVLAAACR